MTPSEIVRLGIAEGVSLHLRSPKEIGAKTRPGEKVSAELAAAIRANKAALLDHLNRRCVKCSAPYYTTTYYGDRICQPCCQIVAADHDKNGTWPE